MALVGRHNIAKMRTSTTGTGTLTLTTAVSGFLTFALAGVVNAERVTYTIRDGSNSEVGVGTYTSSGTTLSRDTVLSSTNGGSKISLTGNAVVAITIAAEDIQPFASYYGSGGTINNAVDSQDVELDSEALDYFGLASLSSNALVIAKKGVYVVWLHVDISAASAFNGRVLVSFNGPYKQEGYSTAQGIQTDQIYLGPLITYALTDAANKGTIKISNHTGVTLDYYVEELTIWKLGEL